MEVQELATEMMASYLRSPKGQEFIAKTVETTCQDAIKEAMGKYSDFSKQVQKAVTQALKVDQELDLPSYGEMIVEVVRRQAEGITQSQLAKQVQPQLAKLLTPAPERIKLTELVKEYVQMLREKNESGCVCYGDERIGLEIVKESTPGFLMVKLKESRDDKTWDVLIGLHLESKDDPKMASMYHLRFDDVTVEQKVFRDNVYSFDRSLLQMKSAGTLVELDEMDPSNFETSYSNHDD
jgi:hypothetical protein